jgi:hypothetical protein
MANPHLIGLLVRRFLLDEVGIERNLSINTQPMVLVSYKLYKGYRTVKTHGARFWTCSRPTTPPR